MNKNYPKTYRENMAWRTKILNKCRRDKQYREQIRELFFRDPIFAFNAFFFTYDPRKRPFHVQPFCTYPYQDEYILGIVDAINNGEDYLGEKSRDMGATWMILLCYLWFWDNPTGGADFLCGSRKEDYVDKKGDPRALFEKLRFALYRLPKWLLPKGFKKGKHDNYMRLQNPETGASITGESNNPNFGTGGRYLSMFFDEFAKWESTDTAAWTSAGDATPCRLPNSTPFGAGGQYYNLAHDGKIIKMRMHWTKHPEKALGVYCEWPPPNESDKALLAEDWEPEVKLRSPWYDKECERRSEAEIAQELDIDYMGAGNPVFTKRAGKALSYYRKLRVEPVQWLRPNLDSETWIEITKPRDDEGVLTIYQKPSHGRSFVVCADVAEGKITGDWSIIKVYCRETKDVAATYYCHIGENDLAYVMRMVAKLYSVPEKEIYPWVAPEANSLGIATFNKLLELGVPNLFMMPKYDTAKAVVTYRKGWVTTGPSRNMLIAGIREYLENKLGFIDPRLVGELGTFVHNQTGKAEAKAGCHDDEVMCFGICVQVDQLVPMEEFKDAMKPVIGNVPEGMFEIQESEESEEDTIEVRCLATLMAKKGLRDREEDFFYGNETID